MTILFQGEQDALYGALSRFSYEEAEEEAHVLSPHSREINREYKEKLVFQVLRHYCFSAAGKERSQYGAAITTVSAAENCRARAKSGF